MSDDYSYRDARLSLWQAAARETHRSLKQPTAKMTMESLTAKPPSLVTEKELMRPVHIVAHTIRDAGKPFEFLVHEVKKGILDLKAKFNPLEDCAKAAAQFLWAEIEGNEQASQFYQGELRKSVCDAVGWAECLTTYLGYKALLEEPVYRQIRTSSGIWARSQG